MAMLSLNSAWGFLLVAGLLEVCWVVTMKYSNGFERWTWTLATLAGMAASFYCLSQAMQRIPMGTAYAIWTGIGAVGGVVAGIVLFHESAAWPRLVCVAMVVAGIIGLKTTASAA